MKKNDLKGIIRRFVFRRSFIFHRKVTLVFLAVSFLRISPVFPQSKTITTLHFEVHYGQLGEPYAESVSRSAEQSFAVITRMLGFSPAGHITVLLTATDEEFREFTHGAVPDWSAAVAVPGDSIIISPLPGQKISIDHILAHEIVHTVISSAAGDTFVPRWFHEGCAEIFSGQLGIQDQLYMVWKAVRSDLLTFQDIERLFSAQGADVSLAYDQSMLAVKRLIEVYGNSALYGIIDGLRRGDDFESAFRAATGSATADFEHAYLIALGKTYGTRALWTIIPGTWSFIMLLAIVVYIIKKRRTRRLMKQWEAVEAAENIIRFNPRAPDDPDESD